MLNIKTVLSVRRGSGEIIKSKHTPSGYVASQLNTAGLYFILR